MDLNDMKRKLWNCLSDYDISGVYLSHNYGYLDPDNRVGKLKMYVMNNHANGKPICPYTLVWTFLYNYATIPDNMSLKLFNIVKRSLHYTDTSILLTNSTFSNKFKGYIYKTNRSFANSLNIGMKIIDSKIQIKFKMY